MGKLVVTRSTGSGEGIDIRIKMPLTTAEDIKVDMRPTIGTGSWCHTQYKEGNLMIAAQVKSKKDCCCKIITKACSRRTPLIAIYRAAKGFDKRMISDIRDYNVFRLSWIGMLLDSDVAAGTYALPTTIGTHSFVEEVRSYKEIAKFKLHVKNVPVKAGGAVAKSAVHVTGVIAMLACFALSTPAGIVALPILGLGDDAFKHKVDGNVLSSKCRGVVKNCLAITRQPNIAFYLDGLPEGTDWFNALDAASNKLGGVTFTKLNDAITDLLVEDVINAEGV